MENRQLIVSGLTINFTEVSDWGVLISIKLPGGDESSSASTIVPEEQAKAIYTKLRQ